MAQSFEGCAGATLLVPDTDDTAWANIVGGFNLPQYRPEELFAAIGVRFSYREGALLSQDLLSMPRRLSRAPV